MSRRRQKQPQRPVEWNFLSFPVYFGFAVGAFLSAVLLAIFGGYAFGIVFIASLFGVSFGLAHITTHWFHRRTLGRAQERAEEEERERRALAARAAAAREGESHSRRRRRRRGGRAPDEA